MFGESQVRGEKHERDERRMNVKRFLPVMTVRAAHRSVTIPAPGMSMRALRTRNADVFSRTWQVMGAVDQCQAWQFVSATVAGEPLVAVRGNDGVLRAFYNVCPTTPPRS